MFKTKERNSSKKYFLCATTFITLMFSTLNSYAGQCIESAGKVSYGNEIIPCLKVAGKATLNGTTVQGLTRISGSVFAKNANLNQLNVSGKADLTGTMINGTGEISGLLTTFKSQVLGDLTISSNTVELESTTTKNITINPGGLEQVLYLTNSIVEGNVIFTSGNGVVYLRGASQVTGKIIGGKIA